MEKKRFLQSGITYFLAADTKPNTAGEVKIYLRFYQKGRKTDYFTGIRWPADRFDKTNQCLLKRQAHDPDCLAYNLLLGEIKKVAHQVHLDAFANNKEINIATYLSALGAKNPTLDFVAFAKSEVNTLYNRDVILYHTWRQHRTAITKFSEFLKNKPLPIARFNLDIIQHFDAYARREKASNTVAGYHKVLKKFLNVAVRKGLIDDNPYKDFKFRYVDGDRQALTQEEVKRLRAMFDRGAFIGTEKEVLRRFLFSCLTGIRISDTHRVRRSDITDNVLKFKPKKGLKYGKIVQIPLPAAAIKLIEGREDLLFEPTSDKHINDLLKIIAAKAGIPKRLTYHCARDTFGTIFIELGGDIKSLADLMGHSSTKTTAIYLKMSDQRKKHLMTNFDNLFSGPENERESMDNTDNVKIIRMYTNR